MKDAEDEAFDELAKRQGHWGGGYQAKRQMAADKFCDANCVWTDHHPDCNMAADKLQEPVQPQQDESDLLTIAYQSGFYDGKKAALAQPAQEPVARVSGTYGGRFVYDPINPAAILPVGMALYSSPQGNK